MNRPAITFDLDCTLVDRAATISAFAERFVACYAERLVSGAEEVTRLIRAVDRGGYASRTDVCIALADQLAWRAAPTVAAELIAFWRRTFPECSVPAAGALEVLASLRQAGHRLALISNGDSHTQRRKLAAIGASDAFDCVVISGAAGVRKPEPAIFELALRQLGARAAEAWHVGDHPLYDIEGARRAGMMRAVWVTGAHDWPAELARPQHVVTSLAEILTLLGRGGLCVRSESR